MISHRVLCACLRPQLYVKRVMDVAFAPGRCAHMGGVRGWPPWRLGGSKRRSSLCRPQYLWRAEIAAGDCTGPVASCWRNVLLDGEPASIGPNQQQPAVGLLSFDYVSYQRLPPLEVNEEGEPVETPREQWRQLTPSAFSYLLKQLTDADATTTALGDAHFVSLLREWQDVGLEEVICRRGSCKTTDVVATFKNHTFIIYSRRNYYGYSCASIQSQGLLWG